MTKESLIKDGIVYLGKTKDIINTVPVGSKIFDKTSPGGLRKSRVRVTTSAFPLWEAWFTTTGGVEVDKLGLTKRIQCNEWKEFKIAYKLFLT